jgi:hypothetical protein
MSNDGRESGMLEDSALRVEEWLDWLCRQAISRRGVLPTSAERAAFREQLRPMAVRLADHVSGALTDAVRLYGRQRQAAPERALAHAKQKR